MLRPLLFIFKVKSYKKVRRSLPEVGKPKASKKVGNRPSPEVGLLPIPYLYLLAKEEVRLEARSVA